MRICVGLVVLYSHFCYSFDLLSYVSPKHAWMDGPIIKSFHEETPTQTMPDTFPDPDGKVPTYELAKDADDKPLKGMPTFSAYFHLEDPAWIYTAHTLILIVMFLFLIGFATPVTSVLTLLGALCYVHRCQTSMFGQDSIVVVLLFYMALAPCGAALSLDRWLEVRRE